jgi:hypothetical protein
MEGVAEGVSHYQKSTVPLLSFLFPSMRVGWVTKRITRARYARTQFRIHGVGNPGGRVHT